MRTLTGVSIGGSLPVIYSVLGDLYPARQRNAVAAIISFGMGLGIGVGQGIAGFLGDEYGWRLPFLIVSIPGLVVAIFLFKVKDPERGGKEAAKLWLEQERRRQHESEPDSDQRPCNRLSLDNDSETDEELNSPLSYSDTELGQEIDPLSCGKESLPKEEKSCRTWKGVESDHVSFNRLSLDNDSDVEQALNSPLSYSDMELAQEVDPLSFEKGRVYEEEKSLAEEPTVDVENEVEKKVSWKTTVEMLKTPTVTLTLLQAAPGALPFGFVSVFLNDYLSEDRGMTTEEATGVLMSFGVGNAIGVIVGGVLGHYAYKGDVRYPPLIMGTSLILSVIPTYFLVNWVDAESNIGAVAIVGLLAGILAVIPVPLERAILTNVTVPESRGRANSCLTVIDDLGKALGPALVAVLIQRLDRPTAFNISLLGWIVGGIISFVMYCFVKGDEDLTQKRVKQTLEMDEALKKRQRHSQLTLLAKEHVSDYECSNSESDKGVTSQYKNCE